jgi:HK97 family phage major capsid protein
MPRLNELREQRAAKVAEMEGIHAKEALEGNEEARFRALETEVRSLNEGIRRAETMAEFERYEAQGETVDGELRRELRNFSLAKAARESMTGKLTGLEAEVHTDLARGREVRGVMVPTEIILGSVETRAVTTTTPLAGPGGNLVRTDLAAMTDRRRPALKVESLGATVLRGLTGNLDLPRLAGSGTAHWIAEHDAPTRSDAKFEKKAMGPKTVSGEYELSRRMVLQSNEAIESVLRADLGFILAQALDFAAIKGGGSNQPVGILSDSDVAQLVDGLIGSDLTADLIAALEMDDVTGTRAFLTNPAVIARARKLKDGDGLPIPVGTTFHGERVEATTQAPITTPAVTGASPEPAKYPLIYGEWASLYVGYWSGVDILVNPYHADVASKGGVLLHAFLDADVVVRHDEAFRWAEVG